MATRPKAIGFAQGQPIGVAAVSDTTFSPPEFIPTQVAYMDNDLKMVWNAHLGLGREWAIPYSQNLTCYAPPTPPGSKKTSPVRNCPDGAGCPAPGTPLYRGCLAEGPYLFDLAKDPTESHDLRFVQPAEYERMKTSMMAWYEGVHASAVTESGCLPPQDLSFLGKYPKP